MAAPDGPPVLAIGGRVSRADIPELCARARAALARCDGPAVCDVSGLAEPDAAAVDLLARFSLIARSTGCRISLSRPSVELLELLAFVGLVGAFERLTLELGRETEQREQARGVEEEADPGDPPP